MKTFKILVWYFYAVAGECEKEFDVHEIEAENVQEAVNKAADMYNSKRAIPFQYMYAGEQYAPTNFNKFDLYNLTQP